MRKLRLTLLHIRKSTAPTNMGCDEQTPVRQSGLRGGEGERQTETRGEGERQTETSNLPP